MYYTPEEASLIDGVLATYILPRAGSAEMHNAYMAIHQHLQQDQVTAEDLQRIKDGLYFVLPLFKNDMRMHRDLIGAIATTHAMIKGVTIT